MIIITFTNSSPLLTDIQLLLNADFYLPQNVGFHEPFPECLLPHLSQGTQKQMQNNLILQTAERALYLKMNEFK
jgi:hypothetical protein